MAQNSVTAISLTNLTKLELERKILQQQDETYKKKECPAGVAPPESGNFRAPEGTLHPQRARERERKED